MNDYNASIVCVVFNDQYEFEDILLIGIANSMDRAKSLIMNDISRVMRDFGSGKCEIEEAESEYGVSITVVHTRDNNDGLTIHWHYYCLLDESEDKE